MIYRRDGLIFMTLKDKVWREIKLAKILPSETSNWGCFQDSFSQLSKLIPEVGDEEIDRAMRGDATPLMNSGVREPKGCLKLIGVSKMCDEQSHCVSYNQTKCVLGHRQMPDCFSPEGEPAIRPLILAWLEGFYIIRERD
jgi:hypothetical protein